MRITGPYIKTKAFTRIQRKKEDKAMAKQITKKNETVPNPPVANEIAQAKKAITDRVMDKLAEMAKGGTLIFPANYSPENAMKSAWLTLQEVKNKQGRYALEHCTMPSISNALLDMVIQGLSPAKKQCYFIMYGNQLQLLRSYMGTVATAKRVSGIKSVSAQVIYEKDVFDFVMGEEGEIESVTHETGFANIDIEKIKGAYACVTDDEGRKHFTVMTIDQIRKAWNQGQMKGEGSTHRNFADEMAKKTVINRACKLFINTSDDSDLLAAAWNRTTANEYPKLEAPGPAAPLLPEGEAAKMDALLFGTGVPESANDADEAGSNADEPADEPAKTDGEEIADDDLPDFLKPDESKEAAYGE
jgi:recombination protein RecT